MLQLRTAAKALITCGLLMASSAAAATGSSTLQRPGVETAVRHSAGPISTKFVSAGRLLSGLVVASVNAPGYSPTEFGTYWDADGDGCDTSREVLYSESVARPRVGERCQLRGGRWVSSYDGKSVHTAKAMTVDHVVPLGEAWQSGGWRWSAQHRLAYFNDNSDSRSLIAVSVTSARVKGGRAVPQWSPADTRARCTYVSSWVAVKWRWRLSVDTAERSYLAHQLQSCGWPNVIKPARITGLPAVAPGIAVAAAAACTKVPSQSLAVLSTAFPTTAGVVKSRRVGPAPSPAQAAWASVPDHQAAFWCEFHNRDNYSVIAVSGTAKPIRFVTSKRPLLSGPEGPLVP